VCLSLLLPIFFYVFFLLVIGRFPSPPRIASPISGQHAIRFPVKAGSKNPRHIPRPLPFLRTARVANSPMLLRDAVNRDNTSPPNPQTEKGGAEEDADGRMFRPPSFFFLFSSTRHNTSVSSIARKTSTPRRLDWGMGTIPSSPTSLSIDFTPMMVCDRKRR
jgi:hypothetical protein